MYIYIDLRKQLVNIMKGDFLTLFFLFFGCKIHQFNDQSIENRSTFKYNYIARTSCPLLYSV